MAENMSEASKPAKRSFFKSLKSEFNKITWPGKKTLVKETIAVVVYSVILAAFIALVDLALKYGINALGIS